MTPSLPDQPRRRRFDDEDDHYSRLCRLWTLGPPVPYPVLRNELDRLWFQAVEALDQLAAEGLAHGDRVRLSRT